ETYIDNIDEQFNDKAIKNILDNYIRDLNGRFDRLRVKFKDDGKYYPVKIFNEDLGRDFTVTDLLYIAAVDICEGKHVYVTRYPVSNYLNIYPSKISILSTSQTTNQKIQ